MLRNHVMDFVEICNVCATKVIIKDAKRIFTSDKMCCSYSDLNFGVTFFGTQCTFWYTVYSLYLSLISNSNQLEQMLSCSARLRRQS